MNLFSLCYNDIDTVWKKMLSALKFKQDLLAVL
jgi:hypothetical protein